jgi:hypothetical protein
MSNARVFSCLEIVDSAEKAIKFFGEDENVLLYTAKEIRTRGHLTPAEFLYILVWKAPRKAESEGKAANNALSCIWKQGVKGIKNTTEEAFQYAAEDKVEDAVNKLSSLHGVSTRVASAILTFYDPERFGIIDKLAWRVLYDEEKENFDSKDYLRYLNDIRVIAERCKCTARIVDVGLWRMGWRAE